MKKIIFIVFLFFNTILSGASKPLKDYSFINGVCYSKWRNNDIETIEREMIYARRLNINSSRIWLDFKSYQKDPATFIIKLRTYIRIAKSKGITTMPILFNGNFLDPATLKTGFRDSIGDKYVTDVVSALKDEEGILIWDIMNEPSCNDYYMESPLDEKQKRWDEISEFVTYYCKKVKMLDPKGSITVGHTFAADVKMAVELVDVISFHDYQETRKRINDSYSIVNEYAVKYKKPIINSETGCVGRANPYDAAIEVARANKVGFYLFELMIDGYWSDIHGIVYSDGTVRDPAIIAALYGFYRNAEEKSSVRYNLDKEGYATRGIKMVEDILKQNTKGFQNKSSSTDSILDVAEYCANLLESGQMIEMVNMPTAKIKAWRAIPEKLRDAAAIRSFTFNLALLLKKQCNLF